MDAPPRLSRRAVLAAFGGAVCGGAAGVLAARSRPRGESAETARPAEIVVADPSFCRYAQNMGCGICVDLCPVHALSRRRLPGGVRRIVVDPDQCVGCGICVEGCPSPGSLILRGRAADPPPAERQQR